MLKVLGVNDKTVNERGIILEIQDSNGIKTLEHFWYVKSFSSFAVRYSKDDIDFDDETTTFLYIPIQENKYKYFKNYVNTIEDILSEIEFKYHEIGYERVEITGIKSFVFDVESSQDVYNVLYEVKKNEVIIEK